MEWERKHDPLPQVDEEGKQTHATCNDKTDQDISYDKDVAEIKLTDVVPSSNYDTHFVKDVCVDEGFHSHDKISADKVVGEKASSNFNSSMGDLSGDLNKDVGDDGTSEAQYSSEKTCDIEGKKVVTDLIVEIIQEKLSLEEVLTLESAADAQQKCTVSSDYIEDHRLSLDGKGIDQVSVNNTNEVGAVGSETSGVIHDGFLDQASANGFSESMLSDHTVSGITDAGVSKSNWYNPFITDGFSEDTLYYEQSLMSSMPYTSEEAIHDIWNISSLSTVANDTSEERSNAVEAEKSRNPDAESSVQHFEQKESIGNEFDAWEETAAAVSVSSGLGEPNDTNGEDHANSKSNSVAGASEINPRAVDIVVNGTKNNIENKNSSTVQNDPLVEEIVPDSAKVSARGVNRNLVDLSCAGPSIISGPMSASGHIPHPGSMSIRSDSSTTSTRSFAFPILQTEWNSSPVKMAKADRRRFRRHRGWRTGILCCKF